jgi:putative Mg2+ transporter-C (MgtC) family protein
MIFNEIAIRFLITFVLSAIFGLERQRAHKPIGFGSFVFVAIGSCALGIIAINLNIEFSIGLLGATVTGIGFLGAGALIKSGERVYGARTAAGIWLFAILGLVVGIGEYMIGIVVYLLVWITIGLDMLLEKYGIGSYQRKIVITTNKIINEKEIEAVLGTKRKKLVSVEVNKTESKIKFVYLIEGTKEEINSIPDEMFKKDWFESLKAE